MNVYVYICLVSFVVICVYLFLLVVIGRYSLQVIRLFQRLMLFVAMFHPYVSLLVASCCYVLLCVAMCCCVLLRVAVFNSIKLPYVPMKGRHVKQFGITRRQNKLMAGAMS